ncbi:MAG: carboxypeptidase regulatory-like domain-containing protein [Patescibacteria group bacterium]
MRVRKIAKLINAAVAVLTIFGMLGPFSMGGALVASAAGTATVIGVVTEPDGVTPVVGAYVNTHTSSYGEYTSVWTDSNGAFSISDVTSGSKILEVNAYDSVYPNPPMLTITVPTSGTLDVGVLRLKNPNVSGVVMKADGVTPVSGAWVSVHDGNWTFSQSDSTGEDGAFGFYLSSTGTYTIEVSASDPDEVAPAAQNFTFTAGGTKTFTGASALKMTVPGMRGKIIMPNGTDPAQYVSVNVHDNSYSYQNSEWVTTDTSGIFKTKSLATGSYTLDVNASSAGNGLIAPDSITVSLTAGTTNTEYFDDPIQLIQAQKTIQGTVRKPNGAKVTDATVSAWPMGGGNGYASAQTNSQGQYSMLVGTGKWQVMVSPQWSGDVPPSWGYYDMPETVTFTKANTVAESGTADFEVSSFDATIRGRVLMPNGSAAGQSDANVSAWSPGGMGGGNNANLDANGYFSLPVPAGTYQLEIMPFNNGLYGAPELDLVTVASGGNLNLGTLRLLEKNEFVTGKIVDSNGTPLENQNVNAWKPSGWGWGWATTDENGEYTLGLTSGTWFIDAMPSGGMGGGEGDSEITYVKSGAPQKVVLSLGETESNINFEFTIADATINGTVQDSEGTVLTDLYSWIEATDVNRTWSSEGDMGGCSGLGGQVQGGSFAMKVPQGTYVMNLFMPWGSDYTAASQESVTVGAGETYDGAVVTVLPNNATITGSLLDQDGNPITDVWGEVFADNGMGGNQWAQFEDGTYTLRVAAGAWHIGYWIDPMSGYLSNPGSDNTVTAAADETTTYDLTLLKADSTIAGTVVDPDGNPISNAWVSADTELGGRQSTADQSMFFGPMFNQGNITDENGAFSFDVPEGTYFVSASLPPSEGYINPKAQQVAVSPDSPADVALEFRIADGTISGTVTLDGEPNASYVWGWSEEGGASETTTVDGAYSLNVIKDETWHIGAIYETTTTFYRSDENIIDVPSSGTATKDLTLLETDITIPAAETATFDSTVAKIIKLTDGTELNMPAYSIATEGNVTVTATPKAQVASTAAAKPIALAYDFVAKNEQNQTISTFNSSVTVKIPYTQAQLDALGITEEDIVPMYYDEASGTWKTVDNVVVDAENDFIIFTVDHFTSFAIVTHQVAMQADGDEDHLSITITKPATDMTVYAPLVTVEGTVSDADASLAVSVNDGTADDVTVGADGTFTSTVQLQPGVNTVAFEATSGGGTAGTSFIITYLTSIDPNADPSTVATGAERSIAAMPVNGGPQVRVYDAEGNLTASFFAYNSALRGEFGVVTADINGDGTWEIITYPKEGFPGHVRGFDLEGNLLGDFFAYQAEYRGGISVNAADVNGDGNADLVVTPVVGSNVRVYTFNTDEDAFELLDWEMAYGDAFRGNMSVAVGDIDANGTAEIAVAPVSAGGPNVRVYAYNASIEQLELSDWFMAYDESYRGGVNVSLANVTGDGAKELVVAPASAGGPNVRVYGYADGTYELVGWFMAYDATYRGGVNLRCSDVDADGLYDIITTPTNGSTNVRIFTENETADGFELLDWFFAYGADSRGGAAISIANMDGDLYPEIVTVPSFGGPNVRAYEYDPDAGGIALLDWGMAYAEDYRGSLNVSVADFDGDGTSELVIAPAANGGPNVRIFSLVDGSLTLDAWFMGFAETFRGGVVTASVL